MPDEVELKDKLLAEDKAEVGLTEQLVKEVIVFLDELVEDVLEDGAYLGHLKDFKLAFPLNLLVHVVVEGDILHWAHLVGVFEGAAELAKHLIACVDDELQIGATALLIEQEDELVVEAEPVEEHHSGPNQPHIAVLCLVVRDFHTLISFVVIVLDLVRIVVLPNHFHDPDEKVHASLECLDAAKLRNVRRVVEVFHPAT